MLAYKATQKNRQSFICDTVYENGKEFNCEDIDTNIHNLHGSGFVVGSYEWAKQRAEEWDGIVLEVEIPEHENVIVFPVGGNGKFRVALLKVIKQHES